MKHFFLIIILAYLFSSCSDKLVKKSIVKKDLEINWYHYSYISSASPDFIEVVKNDTSVVILKSGYGLMDFYINADTIIIRHLKFQVPNEIQRIEPIFNYKIKYKEVSSHEMYLESEKTK